MDVPRFRDLLLAWYDAHRRDLPWRGDGVAPYETWVSEVMLQQTRVETAEPYFRRWMERFPDVAALAAADEPDVLKAWEGLGYYSRARNLHRAARVVRERHAGELPADPEALRALPGVGEYTAGAVGSIAFGHAVPAVDGNVRRVLSRLYDVEDPTPAALRDLAAELVPDDRPGDFNQALMELGATVCTPRSPRCDDCPVAPLCLALARGTVALRPPPKRRAAVPSFELVTLVARRGRQVLLRRRPADGLLANLWEFPSTDAVAAEEPESTARRLAGSLTGGDAADARAVALDPLTHVFSHRRETYTPVVVRLREEGGAAATAPGETLAWSDVARLRAYAMPKAQRRIQAAALRVG